MMATLSSIVFLIALSIWLGGVVFFSFFTAPVIFERLSREQAADLVAVIFPRYYTLGYICGFLMLASGVGHVIGTQHKALVWVSVGLAGLATSISLYAGQVVMPRVRRLRSTAASSAGTPEQAKHVGAYTRAHQSSVLLNTLVLLVLVIEIAIYGFLANFFSNP